MELFSWYQPPVDRRLPEPQDGRRWSFIVVARSNVQECFIVTTRANAQGCRTLYLASIVSPPTRVYHQHTEIIQKGVPFLRHADSRMCRGLQVSTADKFVTRIVDRTFRDDGTWFGIIV